MLSHNCQFYTVTKTPESLQALTQLVQKSLLFNIGLELVRTLGSVCNLLQEYEPPLQHQRWPS